MPCVEIDTDCISTASSICFTTLPHNCVWHGRSTSSSLHPASTTICSVCITYATGICLTSVSGFCFIIVCCICIISALGICLIPWWPTVTPTLPMLTVCSPGWLSVPLFAPHSNRLAGASLFAIVLHVSHMAFHGSAHRADKPYKSHVCARHSIPCVSLCWCPPLYPLCIAVLVPATLSLLYLCVRACHSILCVSVCTCLPLDYLCIAFFVPAT